MIKQTKNISKLLKQFNINLETLSNLALLSDLSIVYKDYRNSYDELNTECVHWYLDKDMSDAFHTIRTCSHKSFLISALVSPSNYEAAITLFKRISPQIMNLFNNFKGIMEPDHWYAKIFTSQTKPLKLINLFVTNTTEPQLVFLGTSLYVQNANNCDHAREHDYNENLLLASADVLKKVSFEYNTDNLANAYKANIVNTDENVDMNTILDELNHIYRIEIEQLKEHPNVNNWTFKPIYYLDLKFLMHYHDATIHDIKDLKNDDEMKDVISLLMTKL